MENLRYSQCSQTLGRNADFPVDFPVCGSTGLSSPVWVGRLSPNLITESSCARLCPAEKRSVLGRNAAVVNRQRKSEYRMASPPYKIKICAATRLRLYSRWFYPTWFGAGSLTSDLLSARGKPPLGRTAPNGAMVTALRWPMVRNEPDPFYSGCCVWRGSSDRPF